MLLNHIGCFLSFVSGCLGLLLFLLSKLEISNICLSLWAVKGMKRRTGGDSAYLRRSCTAAHDQQLITTLPLVLELAVFALHYSVYISPTLPDHL